MGRDGDSMSTIMDYFYGQKAICLGINITNLYFCAAGVNDKYDMNIGIKWDGGDDECENSDCYGDLKWIDGSNVVPPFTRYPDFLCYCHCFRSSTPRLEPTCS